jgi:hypothetical protein
MTEVLTQPTLPETVPTVSFDISLGERAVYIDFDYLAFDGLAKRVGLSGEQVGNYTVHFTPPPDEMLGRYHDDLSQADVYVPHVCRKFEEPGKASFFIISDGLHEDSVFTGDPSTRMNEVFVHETGHYYDFNFGQSRAQTRGFDDFISTAASEAERFSAAKVYGKWETRPWEMAAIAFETEHKDNTKVVTFEPRMPEPRPPRDISEFTLDPKLLAMMQQDGLTV